MANTVSLARTTSFDVKGIQDATYRALDMVCHKPSEDVRRFVIKPNLCYYWDHSTGETTDPRLVSSVIDYIREKWCKSAEIAVVESDASAMKAKHAFQMLGYEELAEEKSVDLVNLSEEETCEQDVVVGKHKFSLPLSRSVLDADFLINVPKMKVGPFAGGQCLHITCSLKNLFGCISKPRKVEYHSRLPEVIVGVNKLVRPSLTVVDGIVALGKRPVRLGIVIAGTDNLAVDFVAANVMGYDPWKVGYLRLAAEENIGDVMDVIVVGENLENIRRLFPRRNRFVFKTVWGAQLSLLRLYTKISGDVVPSVLE